MRHRDTDRKPQDSMQLSLFISKEVDGVLDALTIWEKNQILAHIKKLVPGGLCT